MATEITPHPVSPAVRVSDSSASPSARRASVVLFEIALVATAALMIAVPVLELWRIDFGVPFSYDGGDANFFGMLSKSIDDRGWYLDNPNLGAPFGQALYDFPQGGDNLHLLALRVLTIPLTSSEALNAFYLLTFPAVAATAYFALRMFGRSRLTAAVFGLLYAFLPYHLIRGENHLFLSAYESAPLGALLLYWAATGPPLFFDEASKARYGFVIRRRAVVSVIIALVVGAISAYYAAFAGLALVAYAGAALAARAGWRRAVSAVALAGVIGVSLISNLAPSVLYEARNGPNEEVADRKPVETEYYGLKPAQMVMPVEGHRVAALRKFHERSANTILPSEGAQALGAVATVGFLGMLISAAVGIISGRRSEHPEVSVFGLSALVLMLFATIGGFSLILALWGFTQVRSWNRVTIVIAFYGLAAAAAWLESGVSRLRRSGAAWARRVPLPAALPVVLLLGLLDQTSPHLVANYEEAQRRYSADAALVADVEEVMGRGAQIFQLPYMPFPEAPPAFKLAPYAPVRGYLHSRTLRWSYGGVKGRPRADWQAAATDRPVPEVLASIVAAGFDGLWLDTSGYPDGSYEQQVRDVLGEPAIDRQSVLLYDLRTVRASLGVALGAGQVASVRPLVLSPVRHTFGSGFEKYVAPDGIHWWQAEGQEAELVVTNPLPTPRLAVVQIQLETASPGPYRAVVMSVGAQDEVRTDAGTDLNHRVVLPAGRTVIRIRTNAPFGKLGDAPGFRFRVQTVRVLDDGVAQLATTLGCLALGGDGSSAPGDCRVAS